MAKPQRRPSDYRSFYRAFLAAGAEARTGGKHGVVFTHPLWDRPFPWQPHTGELPKWLVRAALKQLALLGVTYR